jgi:hypothetical protein
MNSMSLMPSESASFPDLLGWHHGYLPPRNRNTHILSASGTDSSGESVGPAGILPASRMDSPRVEPAESPDLVEAAGDGSTGELIPGHLFWRWRQRPTTAQLTGPVPAKSAEENRAALQPDDRCARSPVSAAPTHEIEAEQKKPDSWIVKLVSLIKPSNPTEALKPVEATTDTLARRENGQRPGRKNAVRADNSQPPRIATPLKQRLPGQMRPQIRAQNVAWPTQKMRCRTPARGLRLARRRLFVTNNVTSTSSSHLAMGAGPRRPLGNLEKCTLWETITVGILGLSLVFGLSRQLEDSPLSSLLKVVAIVAGLAAVTIFVIFFWLARRLVTKGY